MIERILAALDFSPRAAAVLDAAAELARRFDARVWPLRVVTLPPEFPPAAHVAHKDLVPAHVEALATEELRRFTSRVPDVTMEAPIVKMSAQPWRAILDASEEYDVDLIVVGSHGYHGIDRVLGTTSGKVANLALRSVLVVHTRDVAIEARP